MATAWYTRFLQHVFHGRALMTEDILQGLTHDIARTRAALAEVLQEVSLALQALDLLEIRLGDFRQPPAPALVAPLAVLPPVVLTRDHRQREQAG
jgi:2-keto-4-pentenoate hydratase